MPRPLPLVLLLALAAIPPSQAGDRLARLVETARSQDDSARARAGRALAEAGPSAIPGLVELLGEARVEVRRTAAEAWADLRVEAPPAPQVKPQPAEEPQGGSFSFEEGPDGPEAEPYPPLEARVLERLGQALADPDPEVRGAIARACCRLGPQGKALVGPLRHALSDPELQLDAALALRKVGPAAAPALPELSALLEADDEELCEAAAVAIGAIGPEAKDAVDALVTTWARTVGVHAPAEEEEAEGAGLLTFGDSLDDAIVQALAALGPAARQRLQLLSAGQTPLAKHAKQLLRRKPPAVQLEPQAR